MSYASFYDTYLKSNASMVTFIVAGAIVTELMFSKGTDALWSAANGGKLVEHVDWAKWSADDDDDDDDDKPAAASRRRGGARRLPAAAPLPPLAEGTLIEVEVED